MTQCYDTLGQPVIDKYTGKEQREPSQNEEWRFWQGVDEYEAQTSVVLECIFARLAARDLWSCGGVCRAWRRAADDPALWRRLLLPRATPHALRALARNVEEQSEDEWSWRKEYALEVARWERCGRLQARGAGSAPLLCAALHDSGAYLALVDEDTHVTIWEHAHSAVETGAEAEWTVRWSGLASPEWRDVEVAQWAPRTTRLLLAGRLALVDRCEMLVVHFDEEWRSRVMCRSACGPGGAGCWVDDDSFLSLRLRLLAPGRACTTVWLNTATQEIYSEFAGVTTPLLRIYNEAATHISHVLLAEIPNETNSGFKGENNETDEVSKEPCAAYYSAIRPVKIAKDKKQRILVAAGGLSGGARGEAQALLAWPLKSLEVPMLWVDDHLAQRVQQRRLRARAPDQPEDPPDEATVRALCDAPEATCPLYSQIYGIILHPGGRCVWATTEAGATCVSLPALTPLLRLPRPAAAHEPGLPPHYILPCVDHDYFMSPEGAGSGRISLWTARSARCSAQLQHGAPAIAVFVSGRHTRPPTGPRRLLVLATDAVHIVRSLTGEKVTGRARRGSCTPSKVAPCAPCPGAPRPPCRERAAACPRGVRLACLPPPVGQRPPCALPDPPRPLTCERDSNQEKKSPDFTTFGCNSDQKYVCGAQLDRVAMRLAAAERVRRLDYEREVAEQISIPAPDSTPYQLAGEHECLRATDGRQYTVSKSQTNRCSSNGNPPQPCPVNLKPFDKCEISHGHHLDPCEHHPRIFLEVDRSSTPSGTNTQSASIKKNKNDLTATRNRSPKRLSSTGSFTTRILKSFKRGSGIGTCPRQMGNTRSSEKSSVQSGDDNWCANLPPLKTVQANCKEQSLTERLRQRPRSKCCNPQRHLHSKTCNVPSSSESTTENLQTKTNHDAIASTWRERMELKEAGQGRVVTAEKKVNKNQNIGAGGLEFKVPPSTDAIRVRVSLDFDNVDMVTSSRHPIVSDHINSQPVSSCKSISTTDSWLSIKNLQKKFSGYRKNENSAENKKLEEHGNCHRTKPDTKPFPKKHSSCTLDPTNEKPRESPSSLRTPKPQQSRWQSPCVPQPKQTTSKYTPAQDFVTTY